MASIDAEERAKALAFLEWLSQELERARLDAVLIGGQARNFWAEPRATLDYDFTTAADAEGFQRLREALLDEGFRIVRDQGPSQPSGPDFVQFIKDSTREAIDFQTAKTEFQVSVVERGVRLDPDQPLRVATAEDLIVLKLIANRPQDITDCIEVAMSRDLDWAYIDHWCDEFQVRDRADGLREAMEQERRRIEDLYRDA